jgi:hypothetical protein
MIKEAWHRARAVRIKLEEEAKALAKERGIKISQPELNDRGAVISPELKALMDEVRRRTAFQPTPERMAAIVEQSARLGREAIKQITDGEGDR